MPETETTTQLSDDAIEQLPEGARARLRQLEKDAKRWGDIEAENNRYKQQEQLRDAGLNLTPKQMKALNAAHEGESNPEAFRKTAEELGFVAPVAETTTEEQQAHQQVQAASAGATVKGELSPEDAYAQANSPAEVLALARERGTPIADDMQ